MLFYLKCIIIACIIGICTILGNRKANTFSKRVMELKNIKSAFQIFISKINFTYEPIADIFLEISKIVYKEENNIFGRTCKIIKQNSQISIADAWYEAIETENTRLKKEDKEIIKMLGRLLGKTDKEGQINEIYVTEKFLDTQIVQAEEEKKKNSKLYRTLGSVLGCTIGILLF